MLVSLISGHRYSGMKPTIVSIPHKLLHEGRGQEANTAQGEAK